jgi:hypothetical protein
VKELLVAAFVALLMAGCGEDSKKPAEDSPESNESSAETPPAKTAEVAKVVVDVGQLEKRDGLRYCEGKPFTGGAVRKYKSGQKLAEILYKDGKEDGLQTFWNEDGKKEGKYTYKDGKKDGWVSRESSVSRRHSRRVISVVGKIFRASLVDKNQCSTRE